MIQQGTDSDSFIHPIYGPAVVSRVLHGGANRDTAANPPDKVPDGKIDPEGE